jgi:hypothetical protein
VGTRRGGSRPARDREGGEVSLLSPPSEAFGTKVGELVAACAKDYPRPATPPSPSLPPAFAVALSGGGFRASLCAVGVLRLLADAGLLERVRYHPPAGHDAQRAVLADL